jgi:putative hydrolase of the HAD superfamily
VRPADRRFDAHVFDLDGVVREFDSADAAPAIEAALGLSPGHLAAVAFREDLVGPTVLGRRSFDEWYELVRAELVAGGAGAEAVAEHLPAWRAHRGTPVPATVATIEALRSAGAPVFAFTNGTDTITAELEGLGLDHLFDAVLNSAVLGVAKPDPAAYARAHAAVEETLGRVVARERVWFTDDRDANVAAAHEFGWTAELFRLGSA